MRADELYYDDFLSKFTKNTLFKISNLCRIFRFEGAHQIFGGAIFEGGKEILLFGKALKFWVIFQKYASKVKKFENFLGKFEKNENFPNFLIFGRD